MINLKEQEDLFKAIGDQLNERTECLLIGGSAMMYYGVKETTKDIDLVFLEEEQRKSVINILLNLGYKTREIKTLYKRKENIPILMEFKDSRLDIFLKKVISFNITSQVIERIKKVYEYNKFIIKIVSQEDIILMKCATERAGDRIDAKELINNYSIDWDIIINESLNQTKFKELLYPLSLYDFLKELKEDLKADIPNEILNKIEKIAENKLDEHSKS